LQHNPVTLCEDVIPLLLLTKLDNNNDHR
jgi:hypothetical protein